jgi:hypothetical protein
VLEARSPCVCKKRRVEAHGIAFHPYASTPGNARDTVNFLHRLVDEAYRGVAGST